MAKKKTDNDLLVVVFVAIVAAAGLWMVMSEQPQALPVVEAPSPEPQLSAKQQATLVGCQESYDFRVNLCNNRRHQASRDACLSQTEGLQQECLATVFG